MQKIGDHIKQSAITLALSPLIALGMVFTAVRYGVATIANPKKALSIAYMVDQTANVDVNGKIDETISARAAKARIAKKRWGCFLCKILDTIQADHCARALANDTHNPTSTLP